MKARGKNTVYALALLLIVYLLLLTCMAYAANPAVQQKQSPVSPTLNPLLNPNAPPQGTITIPASSKGNVNASTWYTGSEQFIQWTCNGTRSNLVDVTLWQYNRHVVVIGKGIASGQTAYTVPSTMAAGSYELRVTSEDDTRVEARQPVTVALPSIVITAPKQNEILYYDSTYTITWTYKGNPGPVNIYYQVASGDLQTVPFYNVTQTMGQGSNIWQIPSNTKSLYPPVGPPAPQGLYNIIIKSEGNAAISASSAGFYIACKNSNCSGYCADLQSDTTNCGWCGHDCGPLSKCVSGQCGEATFNLSIPGSSPSTQPPGALPKCPPGVVWPYSTTGAAMCSPQCPQYEPQGTYVNGVPCTK
jgi:hypothetical protein